MFQDHALFPHMTVEVLRQELQVELQSIQERVGLTFVYVTHDQERMLLVWDGKHNRAVQGGLGPNGTGRGPEREDG